MEEDTYSAIIFYERDGKYVGDSGLYRLAKKEENNPYRIVLYFDQPKSTVVCVGIGMVCVFLHTTVPDGNLK